MELLAESLATRRELADKAGIVGCLEGMAAVALAKRRPERAARLFGTSAMLRETIDAPLSPAERLAYERDLVMGRAQLDEGTFAAAWAEGRTMTLEQAVAYGLEEGTE